ncbi:trypsin-like peptidase domain-containing protein [Corynebacterium doosanense]|uniref:Peptidase S1 domain-containing protein n=1 Tax=Corynebacterium doosanense CAU 212 = DSM 45436 TaxID=558173 RepID=A0A097IHU9_9CORY|nr:hypothetical protein [Corynebacterium doosanense]AIT61703.1 hypothetical protein CDOO_10810 [Corynebacterium doosanense CAU 212 = DSM 45436]
MRSRTFRPLSPAAMAAAGALALSVLAPTAAEAATVAPGAPIRVQPLTPADDGMPVELDSGSCSQAFTGTILRADGTRAPILVTSGHCVTAMDDAFVPSDQVYVPKQDGNHAVGTREHYVLELPETGDLVGDFVGTATGADWATVTLNPGVSTSRTSESVDQFGTPSGDPVVLTGIRDYPDLAPGQFSVDNAGQTICKDGATSGRSCGVQLMRTRNSVFHTGVNYQGGDSGGINFDPVNGEVIGITTESYGPIGRAQPADVALQDAYGIPDGEVNQRFQLAESTERHDTDFRTLGQDQAATQAWLDQNTEPVEEPNFRAEFDQEVASAQADAARYSEQAGAQLATGDVAGVQATANEASAVANGYAETLPELAVEAALQDVLG